MPEEKEGKQSTSEQTTQIQETEETQGTAEETTATESLPEISNEQYVALLKKHGLPEGFEIPDDYPTTVNVDGKIITKPWKDARAHISGKEHINTVYQQKQKEWAAIKKDLEAQKTALEEKRGYYDKLTQRLEGKRDERTDNKPTAAEAKLMEDLGLTDLAVLNEYLKNQGLITSEQLDKTLDEKLKQVVKPFEEEKRTREEQAAHDQIWSFVHSKYVWADPNSEEYKKSPNINSGFVTMVEKGIDILLYHPERLPESIANASQPLVALMEELDKRRDQDLEAVRTEDRAEQKKINEETAPHGGKSLMADIPTTREDLPDNTDDFFKMLGLG